MLNFNLEKWFGKVDFKDWLVSVGSGYGRRFMEPVYDKIAMTAFFQKLKEQSAPVKYLLESLSNGIAGFIDQKIDDQSPLRKLLKETFMDSSSELNKRLINGESVKNILIENADCLTDSKEQELLSIFLTMDEKMLAPLLEGLILMPEEERSKTVQKMRGLSAEAIANLAQLSPEARDMIFTVAAPEKKGKEFFKGAFNPFRKRMINFIDKAGREKDGKQS